MILWRLVVAALVGTVSLSVHAHGFLDHADPKVGSVVAVAPGELRIWFTQDIEPAFSNAEVVDSNGKRVDAGRGEVDSKERSLLRVPLNKLGPGSYAVNWRAVSVDTHLTEGRFTFRVGP